LLDVDLVRFRFLLREIRAEVTVRVVDEHARTFRNCLTRTREFLLGVLDLFFEFVAEKTVEDLRSLTHRRVGMSDERKGRLGMGKTTFRRGTSSRLER
jgi:hypothetical protein